MENTVQNYIQTHSLIKPGEKVIVAISGGADSCVLLHVLLSLNYECVAAHCNFHLRGEESMRDELFVTELVASYNCRLHKTDFQTEEYAADHKISIEMAARELRYNWFEEIRQQEKAACIAVAHHSDDVVETILMNLTRGTGINGLTGIKPRNGNIVRPLLNISRVDVMNYVTEHNLAFVTDSTNTDVRFTRNYIRNEIIPAFEKLNPSFTSGVLQTAENLRDAACVYDICVNEARNEIVQQLGDEIYISIPKLLQQKIPKSTLFEIIKEYGFNTSQSADVFSVLNADSGKRFFSGDYCLLKDRDYLIISRVGQTEEEEYEIPDGETEIYVPITLTIEKLVKNDDFKLSRLPNIALLDFDKLHFPLKLRYWKKGDAFFPLGMKCKKKLSDYFVDEKYSLIQKKQQLILISENQIVWIVGKRIDERFKITDKTKNILKIIC